MDKYEESKEKVSEYDQEILVPQSQNADQPTRPRGKAISKVTRHLWRDNVHYTDLTRPGNTIKQQPSG